MKIAAFIRLPAGPSALPGTSLVRFAGPWWMLRPALTGTNLLQSLFTGFCPPTVVLTQLGWLDDQGSIHRGGQK